MYMYHSGSSIRCYVEMLVLVSSGGRDYDQNSTCGERAVIRDTAFAVASVNVVRVSPSGEETTGLLN